MYCNLSTADGILKTVEMPGLLLFFSNTSAPRSGAENASEFPHMFWFLPPGDLCVCRHRFF